MTGWQVWGWTVALLGPPALFGTAIAVESWLDRWRVKQTADTLTRLDRLDGLRRHPSRRDCPECEAAGHSTESCPECLSKSHPSRPLGPEDRPEWGRM